MITKTFFMAKDLYRPGASKLRDHGFDHGFPMLAVLAVLKGSRCLRCARRALSASAFAATNVDNSKKRRRRGKVACPKPGSAPRWE
jgi:hypothetical protein